MLEEFFTHTHTGLVLWDGPWRCGYVIFRGLRLGRTFSLLVVSLTWVLMMLCLVFFYSFLFFSIANSP
jgi:hypothetical protein